MVQVEFDRCEAVIADDGTIEYYAHLWADEPGYFETTVEWYLDGELAARDGPMQIGGGLLFFEQPRDQYDTADGLHLIQDAREAAGKFGWGTEVDVDVEIDAYEI